MAVMRGKQAIGLDLGQSSVKLVQVARRGKAIEVIRRETFDAREEGILDERELIAAATAWLQDLGLSGREFSVGIPQYFATTQVSDFPPGVKGDELNEMVTFETVQLAGLSDDAFVSDYHVMEPEFGRNNPVLIGICRQSVVDERADAMREAGIGLAELAMNGIAAANALFFLHPETIAEKSPQMVLDIGVESSTLMVVAAGQVLYVGSLMFGGSKFDELIGAHLGCTRDEAEKVKENMRLDPGDLQSPIMQATHVLQSEIRNCIEHWRSSEREEIAGKMFTRIWLCGGGGSVTGLAQYLGRIFGCSGNFFGPPDAEGKPDARQATALGLALQGLDAAHVSISLCPPIIRWIHLRMARFGYLVGAAAIALFLVISGLLHYNAELDQRKRELSTQIRNLEQCEKLIPKLEESLQLVRYHEKMMIPVVELANRAGRFVQSINVVASACGENDWFIYLADEFSFEEGKPREEEPGKAKEKPTPAPSTSLFPKAITSLDGTESTPEPSNAYIPVTKMERLRSMILAGHSPKRRHDSLEAVREIRRKLNESDLFENADLLPKPERVGREQEIFKPWLVYMQAMARKKLMGMYISFMFRLPFADVDVYEDKSADSKHSKKKKKKK